MSINLYTCTQADLESLNKVGPGTAAKIIALRQEVIGGLGEPLQVADLAVIRLSVEGMAGILSSGYYQIPMEASSKHKTSFNTRFGSYQQASHGSLYGRGPHFLELCNQFYAD